MTKKVNCSQAFAIVVPARFAVTEAQSGSEPIAGTRTALDEIVEGTERVARDDLDRLDDDGGADVASRND